MPRRPRPLPARASRAASLVVVGAALLGTGCARHNPGSVRAVVAQEAACDALHPRSAADGAVAWVPPSPLPEPVVQRVADHIGPDNLATAHALGAAPALHRALSLDPPTERQRSLAGVRAQVQQARLDVADTRTALACEAQRVERLAEALDARAERTQRGLAIAMVTVGAVSTVASVALASAENYDAADLTSLLGLGTEATLDVAQHAPPRPVKLELQRDPLVALVTGDDAERTFAPAVWSLLNTPRDGDGASLRDHLVRAWSDDWHAVAHPLRFGDSLAFHPEDLLARAALLDEANAQLAVVDDDLARLLASLDPVPSTPAEPVGALPRAVGGATSWLP